MTYDEETLRVRGWRPVLRDRVVGRMCLGSKTVPVVDGQDVIGWRHPSLEFLWPRGDALSLEEERDKKNPQVLSLLRVGEQPGKSGPGG